MPLPKPLNPQDQQTTFVVDDDWWLLDPGSLEFQVYARTDLQTVAVEGARQTVDLSADRLGHGYYQADLTPLALGAGRYFVRWYVTDDELEGGSEVTWDGPDFEVLADGAPQNLPGARYALVADLRSEGVPAATVSDIACLRAIYRASRYVETFTGRTFGPKAKSLKLDMRGGNMVARVEEPIIALSRVALHRAGYEPDDADIDRDLLLVYNRHLRDLMTDPDDRESPRIELQRDLEGLSPNVPMHRSPGLRWPIGMQDLLVAGAFGFTEADGSPMGRVPTLIQHATVLLAVRELANVYDTTGRSLSRGAALRSEKTRDQSVTYETAGGVLGTPYVGAFTGDAEIDSILAAFRRPPGLAAV